MKTLCALIVSLLLPAAVYAQAPTVTAVQLQTFRSSAPTTVLSTISLTVFTCNLAPSPANAATVNPTKLEWDDAITVPAVTGRVCQADITATINALAADVYIGKAALVYSDGTTGALSVASSPFTRFFYGVLTGLRFVK